MTTYDHDVMLNRMLSCYKVFFADIRPSTYIPFISISNSMENKENNITNRKHAANYSQRELK